MSTRCAASCAAEALLRIMCTAGRVRIPTLRFVNLAVHIIHALLLYARGSTGEWSGSPVLERRLAYDRLAGVALIGAQNVGAVKM